MFDLLTKPGSAHYSRENCISVFEPHVSAFSLNQQAINRFAVPFQMLTYGLTSMMLAAVAWWMFHDSTFLIHVTVWTFMLITPFYLSGIVYYLRFYSREQATHLEIDHKNQLIQYKNRGDNVLFRFDQVKGCHITISTFLPYRLEYTSLQLAGGLHIHISNLVVDPVEIVSQFEVPYQVHRRMFNSLPVGKA